MAAHLVVNHPYDAKEVTGTNTNIAYPHPNPNHTCTAGVLDGFDETTGQHSACGHWQGAWAKDRYFYPFHKCLEAWQRYAFATLVQVKSSQVSQPPCP